MAAEEGTGLNWSTAGCWNETEKKNIVVSRFYHLIYFVYVKLLIFIFTTGTGLYSVALDT